MHFNGISGKMQGEVISMYKKMYLILFNAIDDAMKYFMSEPALQILIQAQQEAEKIYVESDEKEEKRAY